MTKDILNSNKKEKLIEVNKLSVYFERNGKSFRALNNIDFEVHEGEIVGLVGESGSGKTTLGRSIIGLWSHSAGNVKINGKEVFKNKIKSASKKTEWVFKEGQMIFQDPNTSLNQKLKVLDIVAEGLINFKVFEKEGKEKLSQINNKIEDLKFQLESIENPRNLELNQEFDEQSKLKQDLFNKNISNSEKHLLYLDLIDQKQKLEKILSNPFANEENNEKDIKKRIKLLKRLKKTDRWQILKSSRQDFEYIKQSKKDEVIQFGLLQSKTEQPENFVSELVKSLPQFIKAAFEELKEEFKENEKAKNELNTIFNSLPKFTDENYLENISKIEKGLSNILSKSKSNAEFTIIEKKLILLKNFIDWKSNVNTTIFKHLSNFVIKTVKQNIENLYIESDDILKLIDKQQQQIVALALDDFKKVIEEENITLNYLSLLLKEKAQFYESFLTELIDLVKNHTEITYNEFYDFLSLKNKQTEKIHLSINSFKFREAIENQKLKLKASISQRKEIISTAKEKLKNINREIKNLNIDAYYNEAWDKTLIDFNNIYATKKPTSRLKETVDEEKRIKIIEKIQTEEQNKVLLELTYSKKNKKEWIKEKVIETLALVGLTPEAIDKFPSSFSGGQKQRIGIARALINKPKFLIADEPISALDVSVQAQVVNLLKELNQKLKLTIIFIAHDLEMVNYISDKIYVMYKGNIVEYGETDKVYAKPTHPYTQSLIKAIPRLEDYGNPLALSDYSYDSHKYNEYKQLDHYKIDDDHYVFGTKEEFLKWTGQDQKTSKASNELTKEEIDREILNFVTHLNSVKTLSDLNKSLNAYSNQEILKLYSYVKENIIKIAEEIISQKDFESVLEKNISQRNSKNNFKTEIVKKYKLVSNLNFIPLLKKETLEAKKIVLKAIYDEKIFTSKDNINKLESLLGKK